MIRTSEQADDSAGAIGDTADRAVDGYAAACRAEPPDPADLARWLIDTQIDGPGWPDINVADFADALGPDGLAAYWQRLTDLAAATAGADRFDHRAFTVRHLREGYLTAIAQDVDALVAHYAEDLTEPYQYVRIGQALRDAAIDRKDRSGYTEAARLLLVLEDLHHRAGTDFRAYLDALSHTHRRKTTLLATLTRAGL